MQLEEEGVYKKIEEKIKNHNQHQEDHLEMSTQAKRKSDQVYLTTLSPLIMRNLYIIIDATKSSKISDFKPSRFSVALKYLPGFINKFLENNPLSQIGVGVAHSYECKHVVDFTSSPINIDQYLQTLRITNEGGFSLGSCLQTASFQFSQTHLHVLPMILLITSSPYSDDKVNLMELKEKCCQASIQVNVISFSGMIQMFRQLVLSTKGQYLTPLNENDFESKLQTFVLSNKQDAVNRANQMVRIGFPIKMITQQPTLCQCHLNIVYSYYRCPRCYSKLCNPPVMCVICQIWVVLPHQILRNECQRQLDIYQAIYDGNTITCYSCQSDVSLHSKCPQCENMYCQQINIKIIIFSDCDILIHTNLKVCPGCC